MKFWDFRRVERSDVRRRYLELVRRHPPDRAPERFTEIHQAYEKLRDPVVRMESKLFDLESSGTMAEIIADVRRRLRRRGFPRKPCFPWRRDDERFGPITKPCSAGSGSGSQEARAKPTRCRARPSGGPDRAGTIRRRAPSADGRAARPVVCCNWSRSSPPCATR